jgi:nucleoside-diphosphate-sugar epimerase
MRDFVNAADVSHAFLLVLDRGLQGISLDPEYSVGSGTAVSVQSFVNLVEKLTKTTTKIHFGSVSQGDGELYFSEANIHPLIKLGWRPRISLVEGILSYLDTQEVK